ncbi:MULTISPECIES: GNAT family N-acetyltransferase [Bacteria]|jgi:ribosomal protein S18 acetylase RimI-like enzyme
MSGSAYAIRPFRVGDEARLAEICVRTGDAGTDASGRYSSDALLPDIFVLPYVARHPDFAFVVDGPNGVVGYVVAAPDTDAFYEWFRHVWWPSRRGRYADATGALDPRDAHFLAHADGLRAGAEEHAARYPAHLHIDLLPEAQGRGLGRSLIRTLAEKLHASDVSGLYLVASAANAGAVAFYPRVGFEALPSEEGVRAFGMVL